MDHAAKAALNDFAVTFTDPPHTGRRKQITNNATSTIKLTDPT
jgi:hypothetical protein